IVAIIAIFAALNVVTDSLVSLPEFPSGVWYSWNFLMSPLTGVALGQSMGFLASFIGVMIGHYIYFIDVYEFLFTIGAPIGAAVSALIFRGRLKPVLAYYCILFAAYFATSEAWQLPFWGMWDTYVAFALLLVVIVVMRKGVWEYRSSLPVSLALAAFIGLEADVLFRIFLFVPCQTYRLFYTFDVGTLIVIWGAGAILTPVKALLSTITTVLIGRPIVRFLRKEHTLQNH
ncbi:MAG: hypothetical protein NWE78_05735, partial [Candidatus Bathyarchaeota archaeon]|nr:hypothetical protein [Candidatus Bathyarchaeota archaeon]